MLIERSYSELGGFFMLVVGRACMPYVIRSVEKRNGTKDADDLKKRLTAQVIGPILAFTQSLIWCCRWR